MWKLRDEDVLGNEPAGDPAGRPRPTRPGADSRAAPGGASGRAAGGAAVVLEWLSVGVVVCVHDRKMDEPWCLVASEGTVPTPVLIRYYGKRWGIEAGFRDITAVPQTLK